MKKDVIYIDIEDDITSIIEKLKASSEKIVALVPPKGNSVLQSVVNLRLLHRAAEKVGKRPVIVSSNQALSALAGGIGLYVAKTLQSKPAIPSGIDFDSDEAAVEVSDDVGNLEVHQADELAEKPDDEMELSSEELAELAADNQPSEEPAKKPADKGKSKKKKVPNFNSFRKKGLIFGGIGLLIGIGLLLIFGRTKSDIVIRAETTPVDIELTATISANASKTDASDGLIKAEKQETKKTLSTEFRATGEKNVGEFASGSVSFRVCSGFSTPSNIPAGTTITNGGRSYTTDSAASFSADNIGSGCINYSTGSVEVTADQRGSSSNVSNETFNVQGSNATAQGSMSGGTNKKVKIISQADVDRARAELDNQDEADIKKELREGFDDGMHVFEDSYRASIGEVRSEPAVGQEANEGRLTAEATYTMLAVSRDDLESVIDAAITEEMPDKDKQRVYESGLEDASFERLGGNANQVRYKVLSLGQYGPEFDVDSLKGEVSGKKIGEVRSYIQDLPGVKSVDIGLSPFWARNLPGTERITVKLEVDENASS